MEDIECLSMFFNLTSLIVSSDYIEILQNTIMFDFIDNQ